jgi:LysR family transcriptional regulator, nitrogen assimilation regulatory protein
MACSGLTALDDARIRQASCMWVGLDIEAFVMDSGALRAFLAIAQSGSITSAADRLGIAQPSLSQLLLRLEDEVGTRLFNRTPRGVTLTEGGRVFEEHARNILRDIERAREDIRGLGANVTGKLAIGLPLSVSSLIGLQLILAVKEQLPEVGLTIQEAMSGHIKTWLESGDIDLAILYEASDIRRFSVKHIATEHICVVGPPGEFAPVDDRGLAVSPVALKDVPQLELILPSPQHSLRQFVENYLKLAQCPARTQIEVDSLAHIKTLVAARHGHTILSHAAIAEELLAGRLSAAILDEPRLSRAVHVARNPSHIVTRASVCVEDVMIEIVRGMIDRGEWAATMAADESIS